MAATTSTTSVRAQRTSDHISARRELTLQERQDGLARVLTDWLSTQEAQTAALAAAAANPHVALGDTDAG